MFRRRVGFIVTGFLLTVAFQGCSGGFAPTHETYSSSFGNGLVFDPSSSVAIEQPAAQTSVKDTVRIAGACAKGFAISVSGNVEPPAAPIVCESGGSFLAEIRLLSPDGPKIVQIQQRDGIGQALAASRTFMLDTLAPEVKPISPSEFSLARASLPVSGTCESGLPVRISIGEAAQTASCLNGLFSAELSLDLATDGELSLELMQTDAAGNSANSTRRIVKDTRAPAVSVSSPANLASVTSPVEIRGACENGSNVEISGSGVKDPVSGPCVNSNYALIVTFTDGAGAKSLSVSQEDPAGNLGSAAHTLNAQAPIVPAPKIAFTAPAAGHVAKAGVSISGTCETGLNVAISGGGVAAAASTTCASGTFSASVAFSSGEGTKTVTVSQTNASGVTGSASRIFKRDSTPPALTIATPPAGTATKMSLSLAGACETGLPVVIWGAGVAAESTAACNSGTYGAVVNLSSGDGGKDVRVSQTDDADNVTTVTRAYVRDNSAPALAITAPAEGAAAETGLEISGTCESGLAVQIAGAGVQAPLSTTCATGAFNASILFASGTGAKVVSVSQTDAAGNLGTHARSFTRQAATLDGAALYAQNCAGCHGPAASSAKLGRTAAQISTALRVIPNMSSLSFLTSAQVAAIAQALVPSGGGGGGGEPIEGVTRSHLVLGSRTYMHSLYTRMFVAPSGQTSDDTNIQNLASTLLLGKAVANGGPCLAYDPTCHSSERDTAPLALASPTGNGMRMGYKTRACDQILQIDKAVHNVLARANLSTGSAIDTSNVSSLFSAFHPGKTAPAEVLAPLVAIGARAAALGYATVDRWRFVVLPMCISGTTDIL